MAGRNSGLLLHITSLPGAEGIGTLGVNAFRFVDFLREAGQKIWQILPLGEPGKNNCPYQCFSTFSGNPLLIDLFSLIENSLLKEEDLKNIPRFPDKYIDFEKVKKWKLPLLKKSFLNFKNISNKTLEEEYQQFLKDNSWWIDDYSLFMSAKEHFKTADWLKWENSLKFREERSLKKYINLLSEDISYNKFVQFLFFRQWFKLKEYANSNGISIMGDLPFYVLHESADVWTNTGIFQLDEDLNPINIGGVPPDYFSETGQLWENPVYDWEKLKNQKFHWWLSRLRFNLDLFDLLRIDHFRGLQAFWSVPAGEKTAINGEWVPSAGFELLKKLKHQIRDIPLIAEDLGKITPEVEKLRDDLNLPGMKVLQFAFTSDEKNKHLPHNYTPRFIAYTGTHDNNTTMGWLRSIKRKEKEMAKKYLGRGKKHRLKKCIGLIWSSCAQTAIIPMQDLLMLGSEARLNTPAIDTGNWIWRFQKDQLKKRHKEFLRKITQKYNR
jgi:4-alpha-glucanotransferase